MADHRRPDYAASQQTELKSARLTLREVGLQDAPFIARESGTRDVARMCSHVPSPNPVLAVEGFILSMRAAERARGDRVRLVETRQGEPLGLAGLHPRADGSWEFGYWYARAAWGRGYATEAGQSLLAQANAEGIGSILAGHFEDNPASGRVLEKLGFAYTGETCMAFSLGRLASAPCRRMAFQHEAGL